MQSLTGAQFLLVALSIVTAFGYAGATIGMKLAAGGTYGAALLFIAIGFVAAALAEILMMQKHDVSMIYVLVIGIETLLVMSFAVWIGETLPMHRIAGAALVLAGLALTLR